MDSDHNKACVLTRAVMRVNDGAIPTYISLSNHISIRSISNRYTPRYQHDESSVSRRNTWVKERLAMYLTETDYSNIMESYRDQTVVSQLQ